MKDLDLFIVAGQSNAVGCTDVVTLDEDKRYYYAPHVMLYEEGNFANFYMNRVIKGITCYMGHDPNQMGIEYGIGYRINKKMPKKEIGLLRYAYGGTTLYHNWKQDYVEIPKDTHDYGSCYHFFKECVENGLKAYRDLGYNPIIRGMVWMQGETDAVQKIWADDYYVNLKTTLKAFRKFFKMKDLKIIVGEIATCDEKSPYSDDVRKAQRKVCDEDKNNIFLSTKGIKIGHDGYHFDGNEDFKLGQKFADEMMKLL